MEENTNRNKARGGHARAQALSPDRRREIAKIAAQARWSEEEEVDRAGLQKATHQGELQIGGAVIPCAVLKDGQRILSEYGITKALGTRSGASKRHKKAKQEGGAHLPVFLASNNIKPFISEELCTGLLEPIKYRAGRRIASGYPAEFLPQICEIWLAARDAGVIHSQQGIRVKKAEILMRGLAHTGISALVDEATGYQEVRDRFALQAILDKYLTDEWAKWSRTFEPEFYQELFRLHGIKHPGSDSEGQAKSTKRPSYVGHWTNDVVYSRLAPGVLEELRRKNPRGSSGHRPRKYFQHFTKDYGVPALREHLTKVTFLMQACDSWTEFKRKLDRVIPKYGDTIPIPFTEKN